jgi:hypothetical protein
MSEITPETQPQPVAAPTPTPSEGAGTPGSAAPGGSSTTTTTSTGGGSTVTETQPQQQATPPAPAPSPMATEPPAQPVIEPQLAFKASDAAATYTDVPLELRYYPNDGLYYFGGVVNGVFFPISAAKPGHIEAELREAATPGYKAEQLRQYQIERLGIG